ncbi:hypothetical protein [Umezawaea tangerina]|uniref:Adhesin domain-containing protein n=1 Tax=Umezawaea tangerina TaxID=84725 RepID=A0A2T0TAD8_9PSEU|nr:hypothetical protein [Umezawaea tangerina]PRY42608.1 hypothetical protein CLV43_104443 [Umezawaea tangerina]
MAQPPADPPEPTPYNHPQWAPPPRPKPKKWPWILGAALTLILISTLANAGKETPSAATSPPTTQAELARAQTTITRTTTTRTTTTRTTTAATTTRTTTAPPTTTTPPPTVYTGQGDDVITLDRPSGFKIVKFECPACTGNTVLKSDGFESLLVNEIGSYSGLRWIDIRDNSRTTTLTVTAVGAWTLTVGGLDLATLADGPVSGSGDAVVFLMSKSAKARITNTGDGNFAVHVASTKSTRMDLPVNTIGGYEGTVPLAGPAFIQVTSSGDWTITPS